MRLKAPEELLCHAVAAAHQAYAPYSNFRVGATLETADGHLFSGCNVENASYGLTLCAERTAVVNMVAAGHRKIRQIAIITGNDAMPYPCGACRQVLHEFATPDCLVHIAATDSVTQYETVPLAQLLPKAFSLDDLPRLPGAADT